MDLTKGRKSKNILDRRISNKDAYISEAGRRFADEKDFIETYIPPVKPKVKLGDIYEKTIKAIEEPKKTKSKPKKKI